MIIKKWVTMLGVCMLVLGLAACSGIKGNEDGGNETDHQQDNTANENENQSPNNSNEEDINKPNENETNENQTPDVTEDQINEDPTIIALVNKEYSLDENYVPNDLVKVDVPTVLENPEVNQLREVAADALKTMFAKAKESDIELHARSGYRSYQTQVQLFQNYLNKHGEEAANRYSARPGQSEHQTGLVMDVTSESVNYQLSDRFGETKEGKWLSEHAHEFGFIIRYPKDAEDITGYIYEPWHIRYLGIDMARKVHESGLTYEEYLEKEGIIDEVTP